MRDLPDRVRRAFASVIDEDASLSDNIISVYAIGSLAKGIKCPSDIDLNIFIKDSTYEKISRVKWLLESLSNRLGMPIDVNLIDMTNFYDNVCNSDLFIHKYRHALFLYELKTVKCHIYGQDIMDCVDIRYTDLIPEVVKLTFTLAHRYNKALLTHTSDINYQLKKYARYACEYSMISIGMKNPYLRLTADTFLEYFPGVSSRDTVESLWDQEFADPAESYNLIVNLSHILLKRYKLLTKRQCSDRITTSGKPNPRFWFCFESEEELSLFHQSHAASHSHRRVH